MGGVGGLACARSIEKSPHGGAGGVTLPADAFFNWKDAPDNAAIQEDHDHGHADQPWVAAEDAAEKQKRHLRIDHAAESNVVAGRATEPEQDARPDPDQASTFNPKPR